MSNDNIAKALQIKLDPLPEVIDKKEIIKKIDLEKEEALNQDFDSARENIKELIDHGKEALDGILKVATETDSPRAYEVVSLMLKTLSELNKDTMIVHEKTANIKKEKITNITNNSIYVGSTTDLQNLINRDRALNKDEEE